MEYRSKYYPYADHRILSGNVDEAKEFLYYNNFIAFILIVLAIIVAQFWFQIINAILISIRDQIPYILSLIIFTFMFTNLFLFLSYYVFKVPIAASFTL